MSKSILDKVDGFDRYHKAAQKEPARVLAAVAQGMDVLTETVDRHCSTPADRAHPCKDGEHCGEDEREKPKITIAFWKYGFPALMVFASSILTFIATIYATTGRI